MSRLAHFTASFTALLVASLALVDSASAQVVAYHHRSTAFGDHAAGASELVRAQGAFLRDEAAAAQQWVNVAAAHDQLQYQRAEHRYQVKQLELQYMQQKAQANRDEQTRMAAADEAAARRLLESAQRGFVAWPTVLTQPKFAASMSMVESLLRNWSPEDQTGEVYRRALATEAGVLRTRVAGDTSIDFASRLQAVRTLRQLQLLASMPEQAAAAPQLAMR